MQGIGRPGWLGADQREEGEALRGLGPEPEVGLEPEVGPEREVGRGLRGGSGPRAGTEGGGGPPITRAA
jgi:hypothetical protein